MKLSGLTPRPWVKLWREERGRFARLPLFARALAAEVLKITEADGTIALGGREPIDALALALGADTGDRRLLRKYLPMLEGVGYVVRDGDLLRLPAWSRRQGFSEPTQDEHIAPPTERESVSNDTRTERELNANQTRTEREIEAKSSESHVGTNGALIDLRDRERERGEVAAESRGDSLLPFEPTPPKPDPVVDVFDHWRTVMGHGRAKLDSKRRRIIAGALKHYTPADCIAAVDGCRASPFHMGENDRRTRYNGIDLIFRSADKIDGFIAMAPQKEIDAPTPTPPRQPSEEAIASVKAKLLAQRRAGNG